MNIPACRAVIQSMRAALNIVLLFYSVQRSNAREFAQKSGEFVVCLGNFWVKSRGLFKEAK